MHRGHSASLRPTSDRISPVTCQSMFGSFQTVPANVVSAAQASDLRQQSARRHLRRLGRLMKKIIYAVAPALACVLSRISAAKLLLDQSSIAIRVSQLESKGQTIWPLRALGSDSP